MASRQNNIPDLKSWKTYSVIVLLLCMLAAVLTTALAREVDTSSQQWGRVDEARKSYQEHKYEDVVKICTEALTSWPDNNDLLEFRGDALYKLKRFPEAARDFEVRCERGKRHRGGADASDLDMLIRCYFENNQLKEASDAMHREFRNKSGDLTLSANGSLLCTTARVHASQHDFASAKSDLLKAKLFLPENDPYLLETRKYVHDLRNH